MVAEQAYYKKGFDELVSDSHSWRNVSNAVPYVIPYLRKTDKLLDVGMGPGTISKDLANYVMSVVGIEPTPELVDLASSQEALPDLVTFKLGSAYNLPFEDESFDVVHAHQVIVHLDDPVKALKEMVRVCKNGGHILVKDSDMSMNVIYPQEYADIIEKHTKGESRNPSTSIIAGRQLKEKAIQAGYNPQLIQMNGLVWFISTLEERQRWCNIWVSRIRASKEVDYESNKKELDEVIKAYEDWRDDDRSVMMIVHAELVFKKP